MKKSLLIIVFAGLLFSCSKDLDVDHNNSLPSSKIIEKVSDLSPVIMGVFSRLNTADYYGGMYYPCIELRGDIAVTPRTSSNFLSSYYNYNLNNVNIMPIDIYGGVYHVIARVNDVIEQMKKLKPETTQEQKTYDLALARMYALRALAHFDLSKFYSHMPSIAGKGGYKPADQTLSIVIGDRVFSASDRPERNTLKKVYDFIEADFNKAMDLFKSSGRDQEEKSVDNTGLLGYWATLALQSRFYLYKGDYQQALLGAEEVINNAPHRLYDTANYTSSWENTFQSESLFEVAVTLNSSLGNTSIGHRIWSTGTAYGSGGGEIAASKKLIDDMFTADDVRRSLFSIGTNSQNFARNKYPGGKEKNRFINNVKVIRLSEVYLIAAEASARSGGAYNDNDAKLIQYYNAIRSRRFRVGYTAATSVSEDNLLEERAKELFLEGHRPFDLLRFERNLVRYTNVSEKETYEHTDFIDSNGAGIGQGIVVFGEWRWFFQIAFREMQANPSLRNETPGSSDKY